MPIIVCAKLHIQTQETLQINTVLVDNVSLLTTRPAEKYKLNSFVEIPCIVLILFTEKLNLMHIITGLYIIIICFIHVTYFVHFLPWQKTKNFFSIE